MIDWLKNSCSVVPEKLPSFPRRRESSHFNTFWVVVFEKITIAVVTRYYPLFQELKEKVNGLLHEQDDLTELS